MSDTNTNNELTGTPALIAELERRGDEGDLLAGILADRLYTAEMDYLLPSYPGLHFAQRMLENLNFAHALGVALLIRREAQENRRKELNALARGMMERLRKGYPAGA